MGYTHYFSRKIDASNLPEAYDKFRNGVEQILNQATTNGVKIADGFGDTEGAWELHENRVAFNGLGELSHETFAFEAICPIQPEWRKGEAMYFDFCKTAEKPYDVAVTASLLWLAECYGDAVEISSDGYWSEWKNGRDLFREVFGYDAKPPFVVEEVQA